MKILITGGCGFIGSNLAYKFLHMPDTEVVVLDNLSRKGVHRNLEWLKIFNKRLTYIGGDIRDFSVLKEVSRDTDVIFHTAAQVAVTTSIKNPRDDLEINALGTLNVLEAARLSNTDPAVIFTSTNKVYGNAVNQIPLVEKEKRYEFMPKEYSNGIPETFPTDAHEHTPYGCSKYAADLYTRDYSAVFGLKTVVFRMSCVYGLRQFGTEDQGWLAHFVISSILKRPLIIYGDGKQVRDILFIDDLTNTFDMAVKNIVKIKGGVYNIGGGPNNTISLIELVGILEKLSGHKTELSYDEWRPFDQKVYISNISKAEKEFFWKPKMTKEEGIQKLYNWALTDKTIFEF